MEVFVKIVALFVLIAVLAILLTFPFMWIWNYAVVAAISIAKPISFWVAFWLSFFIGAYCKCSNSFT